MDILLMVLLGMGIGLGMGFVICAIRLHQVFGLRGLSDVDNMIVVRRARWLFGIQNAVETGHRMRHELAQLGTLVRAQGIDDCAHYARDIVVCHMTIEKSKAQLEWSVCNDNDLAVAEEIVAAWRQVMDIEGGDAEDRLRKMLPALQDDGSWKWRGSDTYEKRKASSK